MNYFNMNSFNIYRKFNTNYYTKNISYLSKKYTIFKINNALNKNKDIQKNINNKNNIINKKIIKIEMHESHNPDPFILSKIK